MSPDWFRSLAQVNGLKGNQVKFLDSPAAVKLHPNFLENAHTTDGTKTVGKVSKRESVRRPAIMTLPNYSPGDRGLRRMYVATSKDNWEGRESPQNLLVYDCSGDTPKLLQNLENQTYNVNSIYPMSQFHR